MRCRNKGSWSVKLWENKVMGTVRKELYMIEGFGIRKEVMIERESKRGYHIRMDGWMLQF